MTDFASLEYSVVGAICLEPRYIERVSALVNPEDFTIAACAEVFETAQDAYSRGKIFDTVIAVDCLKKIMPESSAIEFIKNCMDVTPTVANAEYHAKLVHRDAGRRKLQQLSYELFDGITDAREGAAQMIDACRNYLESERTVRFKTLQDALSEMYEDKGRKSLRLDTGFPMLDGILKGMWGGNLILIGARPGVGKSAFALDIARTVAMRGNKVLIYSLEMLADELAERLVARSGTFSLDRLIDSDFQDGEWPLLADSCERLCKLPILINDDPATTVNKIRMEARTVKDLKLIIVDFITLMRPDQKHENRNHEVGAMSRALKNLASELKIPVITLAQLNRGKEDDEQPTLRSLRDSGELEQNANKVIFLWNIDSEEGELGVSVAKNRRGKTGAVKMHFDGEHMLYTELSEPYRPKRQKRRRAYDDDE